jgi:4-diphosphocytidyl-2-C-methyl-D-erythritol kinase
MDRDMEKVMMRAPAKINWTLDVIGKRPDGYHEIETVMQAIGLYDYITIKEGIGEGIAIKCTRPDVPTNPSNLAWKAAQLIKQKYKIANGLEIILEKNIPAAAGLAGGSTDGAAVLVGLNRLWGLGLNREELKVLGLSLGADVPFCILGGTALARGLGEILTPLCPVEGIWIVLIKPSFGVSTREVYEALDIASVQRRPNTNAMIRAIANRDIQGIGHTMANVMEEITLCMHPQITVIKSDILHCGAIGCLMSGSGPAVYGIFEDGNRASKGYDALRKKYEQVYMIQTSQQGVGIMEEM